MSLLLIAVLLLLTLAGCSRTPHLAGGPIDLSQSPVLVRFESPVPSPGSRWEMCFEFQIPGYSHSAAGIRAVLLTDSARRFALVEPELDRRGEAVVCQTGRLSAVDRPVADPAPWEPVTLEAVELSADVPLRLSGIRGASLAG